MNDDILIYDGLVPIPLEDMFFREVSGIGRFWQDYPSDKSGGVDIYTQQRISNDILRKIASPTLIALVYAGCPNDDDTIFIPEYFNIAMIILELFSAKSGININKIVRIKINKQIQSADLSFDENCCNDIHSDMTFPHKTLLYYFNDSDGDTMLMNERHKEDNPNISPELKARMLELGGLEINTTLLQRVTPKKGRILCFDGARYHAPSNPIKSKFRYVMNINFTV